MDFKTVLTISFSLPGLPHDERAYIEKGIDFIKAPCSSEDEMIAVANERIISVLGTKEKGLIKVKIIRAKHNIFVGKTL